MFIWICFGGRACDRVQWHFVETKCPLVELQAATATRKHRISMYVWSNQTNSNHKMHKDYLSQKWRKKVCVCWIEWKNVMEIQQNISKKKSMHTKVKLKREKK